MLPTGSIKAAKVVLASYAGDHFIYPDCRPEFNEAMVETVGLGKDGNVHIEFPYSRMDERDIGDLGRELGIEIRSTWICYQGGPIHCGVCGACSERKYVLRNSSESGNVKEGLYSNLLRSKCPVTGQPDWATVIICYSGKKNGSKVVAPLYHLLQGA